MNKYPKSGIRPTIDGRRGYLKVRESLEEHTMNMAKADILVENMAAAIIIVTNKSILITSS